MSSERLHAATGLIERAPDRPVVLADANGKIPVFRPPSGNAGAASTLDPAAGSGVGAGTRCAGDAATLEVSVRDGETSVGGRRRKLRRTGGGWVQGELSLSAVRVVRNDLHGADLEFVLRGERDTRQLTLRPQLPRAQAVGGGWRGWLAHWRQWFRARR